MTGAGGKTTWTVKRAASVGALVSLVCLLLGLFAAPPEMRGGLGLGVLFGSIGGAAGLFFVSKALPGGIRELLKAVMFGFFLRATLVLVGLLVARQVSKDSDLPFAAGFFVLFFVFAGLETLVVSAAARSGTPPRPTEGH